MTDDTKYKILNKCTGIAAIIVMLLLSNVPSNLYATEVCHPTKSIDPAQASKPLPDVEIVKTLSLDSYAVGVAWSPDGRMLATAENDELLIKIWNTSDYHVLRTITRENRGSWHTLLFTADSKYLIMSSINGYDGINRTVLSIVDVATGNVVKNVEGPYEPKQAPLANVASSITLSPDGKVLYVKFNIVDNVVYTYDTLTWANTGNFHVQGYMITAGPENDQLTYLETSGRLKVWSISKKDTVQDFVVLNKLDMPSHIAVDAAHCRVASDIGGRGYACVENCGKVGFRPVFQGSGDLYPIRIWDINTGKQQDAFLRDEPHEIGKNYYGVGRLSFSPDGNLLAADEGEKAHMVKLRSAANLTMERLIYEFKKEFWLSLIHI